MIALLGAVPLIWQAAPLLAAVVTAPVQMESHALRISALERADSAADRRLQVIECYVKVAAKLPGYTNEWCLLNPGREP